jgi:hypothetical protein
MTQDQVIQRGFTHFIEVWRDESHQQGVNKGEHEVLSIKHFDTFTRLSANAPRTYTVAIFLIKPKLK